MASTPITGHAPLSFTDSNGDQRTVPLAALVFSAPGKLVIEPSQWVAEFGPGQPYSQADAATLLTLAAQRVAAGELKPPPTAPPAPAVHFQAVTPGPGGNNVSITLGLTTSPSMATPTVFNTTLTITAVEEEKYGGLLDGATARAAIGVDTPTSAGDVQGYGLVMAQGSGAGVAGKLAKDAQTVSLQAGKTFDVLAADGSTVLLTLMPRSGLPATVGIAVNVSLDAGGKTFTIDAKYTPAADTVALYPLGAFKPDLAWLLTASTPGAVLPAANPVQLSGGAPGVAASGIAYTS